MTTSRKRTSVARGNHEIRWRDFVESLTSDIKETIIIEPKKLPPKPKKRSKRT